MLYENGRADGPVPGFVISEHTWENLDASLRHFVAAAGRWAAPRAYEGMVLPSAPRADSEVAWADPEAGSPRLLHCPRPPRVEALGGSSSATRVAGLGASGLRRPRYAGLRRLFDAACSDGRVFQGAPWAGLRELAPSARRADPTLLATLLPWERGGALYLPQLRWSDEKAAAAAARLQENSDRSRRDWDRIRALDEAAKREGDGRLSDTERARRSGEHREAAARRRRLLDGRRAEVEEEEQRVRSQERALRDAREEVRLIREEIAEEERAPDSQS
eukprot:TRINITY_DN65885_c0_g1_i1.p1 TRINITY_DN65885_c0_g1~~TRINITY_DN65885_c0_g1_i1.p1  ORF type:complete len:276 (+),score=73.53 TRINITY_DN65885_c0_g1_i1:78-905(+)